MTTIMAACHPVHRSGRFLLVKIVTFEAPECFGQALAEKEGDGIAKMIYRKDTGEILGVHILGLHATDLIHEASNAVATKQRVQVTMQPI